MKLQKLTDQLLDHLSQIEESDNFERPSTTVKRTEKFLKNYSGSYIDLFVAANLIQEIGTILRDASKELAHTEAILEGYDTKFDWRGVNLTPVESHQTYEFGDDPKRDRYMEELNKLSDEKEPIKQKEKSIKDSIKSREKELIKEGKAKLKSSNKYLKVSK